MEFSRHVGTKRSRFSELDSKKSWWFYQILLANTIVFMPSGLSPIHFSSSHARIVVTFTPSMETIKLPFLTVPSS